MKRLLVKLFPFLFIKLSLNERIEVWCGKINKHISYGDNMTHEMLDERNVDRFKFKYKPNLHI